MSDSLTFSGISMGLRKNRRLLVTVMYAIPLACIVMILVAPSWFRQLGPLSRQSITLASILIFLAPPHWFTKLAKFAPLGQRPVSVEITRLGLTPGPRDPYDPDERQATIRNAAHYHAFRFVIYYAGVLFLALMFSDSLERATAHRLVMALVLLLVFMVLTLPQAIILWTEPDVPEEARSSS